MHELADAHVLEAIHHYLGIAVNFVCKRGAGLEGNEYIIAMQRYQSRIQRTFRLMNSAALDRNLAQVIEHGRTYMILHNQAFHEYREQKEHSNGKEEDAG